MHTNLHARTMAGTAMPDTATFFDEEGHLVDSGSTFDVPVDVQRPVVSSPPHQAVTTTRAMRIVRAASGRMELRLVDQLVDGKHDKYLIETAILSPFSTSRSTLGSFPDKLTFEVANEFFESVVSKTFPPETLRNNKVVPIHINIL